MAPASTVFHDDYAKASEPEHVHAENKHRTRILDANYEAADLEEFVKSTSTIYDIERNRLLLLLRKYEHLFDGTLRKFET
jgi:CBS-domain-containing membrane protein